MCSPVETARDLGKADLSPPGQPALQSCWGRTRPVDNGITRLYQVADRSAL